MWLVFAPVRPCWSFPALMHANKFLFKFLFSFFFFLDVPLLLGVSYLKDIYSWSRSFPAWTEWKYLVDSPAFFRSILILTLSVWQKSHSHWAGVFALMKLLDPVLWNMKCSGIQVENTKIPRFPMQEWNLQKDTAPPQETELYLAAWHSKDLVGAMHGREVSHSLCWAPGH